MVIHSKKLINLYLKKQKYIQNYINKRNILNHVKESKIEWPDYQKQQELEASEQCDERPQVSEDDELSFAWITPRSQIKGLDGGILSRLLSKPQIKQVGARMISPSEEFVNDYIDIHKKYYRPVHFPPFVEFCEKNLRPSNTEKQGLPNHLLFLQFSGKNVRQELTKIIGNYLPDPRVGMVGRTIRGAYGDFVRKEDGSITHFQPAIVGAGNDISNLLYLRVFHKYMQQNGGIFDTYYDRHDSHKNFETGMVMIKPDMLSKPSSLPGHIMDLFGSTGQHLIGCRMFSFSPAQAYAFYGFLENVFVEKLRTMLDSRIRRAQQAEFKNKFPIDDTEYDLFTTILKHKLARSEVNTIIGYMSGVHPDTIHSNEQLTRPGPARCLALLYRGENAIQVIREKLGSTDPSKAAVGTIRSDYGRDIMKNGAHASDSVESMVRERRIIGFVPNYPSMTKKTIEYWLSLREKMEWEKLGM